MIEFLVSYVIILPLYLFSSYPSLPGGDSGELLSEACHLGIAHPPGYPLLTMIWYLAIQCGKGIDRIISLAIINIRYYFFMEEIINHGYERITPSQTINVLCCFLGASTCFILGNSVTQYLRYITKKRVYIDDGFSTYSSIKSVDLTVMSKVASIIQGHFIKINSSIYRHIRVEAVHGAISSVIFGLSPLSWEYGAIGAEVFALNNFLIAIILRCTIRVSIAAATFRDSIIEKSHSSKGKRQREMQKIENESLVGALFCGLALSNQHTSVLFIIPLAMYILCILYGYDHESTASFRSISIITSRKKDKNRIISSTFVHRLIKLVFMFTVGLTPYIYLFIIGSMQPKPGSWGDLSSFKGFWKHILRAEYGTLSLGASKFGNVEGSISRWIDYICKNIHTQFSYFGLLCSVLGIWRLYKVEWSSSSTKEHRNTIRVGTAFLMTLLFYLTIWNGIFSNLPLAHAMAHGVLSRFYLQPNIIVSFFIGVGSDTFIKMMVNKRRYQAVISVVLLSFIMLADRGGQRFLNNRNTEAWIMHDYGKTIIESLPENAMLLSFSDLNWNTVRYFQTCEGVRDDVIHLSIQLLPYPWFKKQIESGMYQNQNGVVTFPKILPNVSTTKGHEGYTALLSRFLAANIDKKIAQGGIFLEMQAVVDSEIDVGGRYHNFVLVPWGLVFRVLPLNTLTEKPYYGVLRNKWHWNSMQLVKSTRQRMLKYTQINDGLSLIRDGSWEFAAMSVFWDMHYELSISLLSLALDLKQYVREEHDLIEVYIQYIKLSSKLLWQVDRATMKENTISHQKSDVIKNAALAHMHRYEATKAIPTLQKFLPSLSLDENELEQVVERTNHCVKKYLDTFRIDDDDEDYDTFLNFYEQMNGQVRRENV